MSRVRRRRRRWRRRRKRIRRFAIGDVGVQFVDVFLNRGFRRLAENFRRVIVQLRLTMSRQPLGFPFLPVFLRLPLCQVTLVELFGARKMGVQIGKEDAEFFFEGMPLAFQHIPFFPFHALRAHNEKGSLVFQFF